MKSITPKALYQKMQVDASLILIDVRDPSEYQQLHIVGARLYPLGDFTPEPLIDEAKGATVYVACKGGPRSQKACQRLTDAAYEHVCFLEGGTDAWAAEQLPVVRSEKKGPRPIIQQVLMSAGIFVFLGTLLGLVSSAWFYLIPLAVGAGLTYAGYSGNCLLAKILMYMPWNK